MILSEIQEVMTFEKFQNSNSWPRRFFRLWLDGFYGFENYPNYENLEIRISEKKNLNSQRKVLRSFIISEFCKFGSNEFNCSIGYFQKVLTQTFSKDDLEEINKILIDELLEDYFDDELKIKN